MGKKTGVSLEDARKTVKEYANKFEKQSRELKQFRKDSLDYAEKSGILDPKTRKKWEQMYSNYVPMQRVLTGEKNVYLNSSLEPKNPFFQLKGSEKRIIDPLESDISNTYALIKAAEQNKVIKALADLSKTKKAQEMYGLSDEVETEPATMKNTLDTLSEGGKVGKNKLRYFDKGKAVTFTVPPEVAEAVTSLRPQEFNLLSKILSYPTRLIRTGAITLSPGTLLKLATIDQLEAFLYTDIGYIPYFDLARGIFIALKKPELYWKWKAAGGDQALAKELSRAHKRQTLDKITGKAKQRNVIKNPDEILRVFEDLSRPLEEATRLVVFEKILKEKECLPKP